MMFRRISFSTCLLGITVFIGGCGRPSADSQPAAASGGETDEQDAAQGDAATKPDGETASPADGRAPDSDSPTASVGETPKDAGPPEGASDVHEISLIGLSAQFPPLGPLPDAPVPADNPLTDAKVALGRLLFFDSRLSGDAGTSCASCHDPRLGWGDGQAVSRGYAGTQHWRNSQTTVNSAFLTKLFWAGEVPSLEVQAKSAITGNLAGNGDPAMIEERLAQIPEYVKQFRQAFGVSPPTFLHVLKAIASFERAELISRDSPFDAFLAGDTEALSAEAQQGLKLFQGKARCIVCHNGPLMSDEDYHFLDVPQQAVFDSDPLRQVSLRYQHFIRGVPEDVYRAADGDLGLYYTTKRDTDRGRFRTPPLRYLEYTAPYMHNGVLATIEDVIDFYDQGGGDDPNQSDLIQPLNLTEDEKFALAEFLYALSGDEIRIPVPELPEYQAIEFDETEPAAE